MRLQWPLIIVGQKIVQSAPSGRKRGKKGFVLEVVDKLGCLFLFREITGRLINNASAVYAEGRKGTSLSKIHATFSFPLPIQAYSIKITSVRAGTREKGKIASTYVGFPVLIPKAPIRI